MGVGQSRSRGLLPWQWEVTELPCFRVFNEDFHASGRLSEIAHHRQDKIYRDVSTWCKQRNLQQKLRHLWSKLYK